MIRPQPPLWALQAGLPEPLPEEGFKTYCERLGLDADVFLRGLTERTAPLANIRLASYLAHGAPDTFRAYLDARKRAVAGDRSPSARVEQNPLHPSP